MIEKYLFVALLTFIMGLVGILRRRNLIMLSISSEILFNATNLALIAGSKAHNNLNGQVFALLVVAIATAEVAAGVASCVFWYRKTGTLELKSSKEVEN